MKTRVLVVAARPAAVLLAALLLATAALPLAAADIVGTITYLEGTVEIVRDGEALDANLVKEGLGLANFDLVKVGGDGEVEARITTPTAPAASLRIGPGTQFSLEIGTVGARQQTTVGLIIGCVTVKTGKLTGSQSLKVQTDCAVMGVRGTSFTVSAPPSGDILVACDEGEVECIDAEGNTERAVPGDAVEKLFDERIRRVPVAAADLEAYGREWNASRISALKADPLKATSGLAKRYRQLLAQFQSDFAVLEKAQKTIDTWKSDDRAGTAGGKLEAMRESREIVGALLRLRKTLFLFERVHARLLALGDYHAQGLGRGDIRYDDTSRESTTQFFQRLERDRRDLERKMARVRLVARLVAVRTGGRLPGGGFDDEADAASFLDE